MGSVNERNRTRVDCLHCLSLAEGKNVSVCIISTELIGVFLGLLCGSLYSSLKGQRKTEVYHGERFPLRKQASKFCIN